VVALAGPALGLGGCTLLAQFHDQPTGSCSDAACLDATEAATPVVDGSSDAPDDARREEGGEGGHDAGDGGADARPDGSSSDPCAKKADGTFCGYLGGCQCEYCSAGTCSQTKACPQGFNWEAGVDIARCCNGLPILTNTNANCGVCGVQCMTAGVTSPQDCKLLSGHYQCVNCAANSECWSGCCAIDTTPYHCSESDCNTGACVSGLCPAPSMCVTGSGSPNYCSY
jgi:hypothetical protein